MEALRASLLGRTCFEKWNICNIHLCEDVKPITMPFDHHDLRVEYASCCIHKAAYLGMVRPRIRVRIRADVGECHIERYRRDDLGMRGLVDCILEIREVGTSGLT